MESGEHWAFDEASREIRSLTRDLKSPESDSSSVSASLSADVVGASLDIDALESALQTPLPMWQDDDLLDIMPVKPAPRTESSDEHWAAQARREAEPVNHAEAAATLLESVARRVREGSLTVPGFTPHMSDAAGLAAALTALLNSRE